MSPERLFDYLEGNLPDAERDKLENDLLTDSHLQRELSVARRIHAGKRGSREVDPAAADLPANNLPPNRVGPRVATAFAGLVALNVLFGIYFIARHEYHKPPGARASQHVPTRPITDVEGLTVPASRETRDDVAGTIIVLAQQFGGSATRGLTDPKEIIVLVDIPREHEKEFRMRLRAITSRTGVASQSSEPVRTTGTGEKKSFRIQVLTSANASR